MGLSIAICIFAMELDVGLEGLNCLDLAVKQTWRGAFRIKRRVGADADRQGFEGVGDMFLLLFTDRLARDRKAALVSVLPLLPPFLSALVANFWDREGAQVAIEGSPSTPRQVGGYLYASRHDPSRPEARLAWGKPPSWLAVSPTRGFATQFPIFG
jgi:hypothetical protein